MPITTPEIKIKDVRRFGAKILQHGDNVNSALEEASSRAELTLSPCWSIFAPNLLTSLILISGVVIGITIVQLIFSFLHALATPCA